MTTLSNSEEGPVMIRLFALVATAYYMFQQSTLQRLEKAKNDERGMTSLEMVVLGLGLFLLAGVVVAVVTAAVKSRTDQIK